MKNGFKKGDQVESKKELLLLLASGSPYYYLSDKHFYQDFIDTYLEVDLCDFDSYYHAVKE